MRTANTRSQTASRRSALRALALVPVAGLLGACGFKLRQPPDLVFKSIYANVAPTSLMGVELRRNLAALGDVELITEPARQKEAQVILDLLQELRQKVVVGMGPAGQVREYQLRLSLRFRLRTPQGKEIIPDTELQQQRDISFNESAVLAKETEEESLYRSMQTDIVQQILRRLASIREL